MAKLTFKGDKPKRKKTKPAPVVSSPTFVDGWTSATELADLNGPVLVLGSLDGVKALAYDDIQQRFEPSSRLDTLADADCVNFFAEIHPETTRKPQLESGVEQQEPEGLNEDRGTDQNAPTNPVETSETHSSAAREPLSPQNNESSSQKPASYPEIHRVEPTSVTQVFTVVSLGTKPGQHALKLGTTNAPYLSFDGASKRAVLAHAIGENELFSFTPVTIPNHTFGFSEVRWDISHGDHSLVLQEKGFVFLKKQNVSSYLVIRAHTSNTVAGARLKALESESAASGDGLQNATARLYKETGGKVKITPELVARLKDAIKKGIINEQIVDEKARLISKW